MYDSKVPDIVAPEYLTGHYMIKTTSSPLPVVVLSQPDDEKVMYLAAASGRNYLYIGIAFERFRFANGKRCDARTYQVVSGEYPSPGLRQCRCDELLWT